MEKQSVIAIDGPAASGKSTVASKLAERLHIPYINTGNLYRAVALAAQRAGVAVGSGCTDADLAPVLAKLNLKYAANAAGVFELELNGTFPGIELRSPEIAAAASLVSALGSVRAFLLDLQRASARHGLVVMEGRDIGTVVFPDARYKFFVTASPEERARRRLAQSDETVAGATLEAVARSIAERDRQDATRAIAPLKAAPDAVLIDTTGMTIDDVVNDILRRVGSLVHDMTYRVPYADTDQMGVVYYANYLEYFERSRTEMLRDAGLPYGELEKMGIFLPVSEASCKYHGSARYDDLLTFRSRVAEMRGARLTVDSEVRRDGELLVSGRVVLAAMNKARKIVRLPEILMQKCRVYLAAGGEK